MSYYSEKRHKFYANYPSFWADLYGSEYGLYHVSPVSNQTIQLLKEATKRMGAVFFKTASLLRSLSDDQLLELGYPRVSLPFLRLKNLFPETVIARFDFAVTKSGIKLLEFNSDTPTFIVECFQMNGEVCRELGFGNPNENSEKLLSSAINKAISECIVDTVFPNVVFTAHPDHMEDWNTTLYLSGLCEVPNKVEAITELRITDDALVDSDGMPIDVLYRQTYPLEHLVDDRDPITGDLVGLELLRLVEEGKLTLLNPISSFLLQPKSIQCLIWGLAEQGAFYTEEELDWIRTYMLPTYFEADEFKGKSGFVRKPSLGREGDSVTIWGQDTEIVAQNSIHTYEKDLAVYQSYIPLPSITLETEKGLEELSYVFGSFLIAGKPGAIGIRAGGKITGNESYFLPIGLTREDWE